jgi:hypothetical protein
MFIYIQNFNEILLVYWKQNANFICTSAYHTGTEDMGNIYEADLKFVFRESLKKQFLRGIDEFLFRLCSVNY